MTIQWGSWSYANGNGARVGMEILSDGTVKTYANTQYTFSNNTISVSYLGPDGMFPADGISGWDSSSGQVSLLTTHHVTLTPGQSYSFGAKVTGFYNGSAPSVSGVNYTAPVVKPSTPGGLAVSSVTTNSAHLAWNAPSDWGGDVGSYEVQVADNSSFSGATTHSTSSTGSDFTGQANNTQYWARVRAKNSAGASGWSSSVTYTTKVAVPSTPGIPTVSNLTQTAFNLTTTAPSNWGGDDWRDADSGRYDFQIATDSAFTQNVDTQNSGDMVANYSGKTANTTYWYRARAKNDAGFSAWTSARSLTTLPDLPASPDGVTASRVSDTQQTVAWTNHPTAAAPYTNVDVLRSTDSAAAVVVASNLTGTTASWSDTSTTTDHKYTYQVVAKNAAGSSAPSAASAPAITTPAAPSALTIDTTASSDVQLAWTNNTRLTADTDIEVEHSSDGATYTSVTTLADGTLTSWVAASPGATAHQYRIRAVTAAGLTSSWAVSNLIATPGPPNAPSNLAPNGQAVDLAVDRVLTWQHNPSDASPQSGFELQHAAAQGNAWTSTGHISSAASQWTLPAGTYPNGTTPVWQVATWGQLTDAANESPFSAVATIPGSAAPTVTITNPTGDVTTSTVDFSWSFYQAQGAAQVAYRVHLTDSAGAEVGYWSGSDATSTITFSGLVFNETYTATVQAQSAAGLWSDVVSVTFGVTYPKPATVSLTAEFSRDSGAVTLYLTPAAYDGTTTVEPIGAYIQRDVGAGWVQMNTDPLDPSASVLDTTAPVNGPIFYRVITESSIPSTDVGPELAFNAGELRFGYLSAGPQFTSVARVAANLKPSSTTGRDVDVQFFEDRELPVPSYGGGVANLLKLVGELNARSSSPDEWRMVAKLKGPHLWRDPTGRVMRVALLPGLTVDEQTMLGVDGLSFTVQEVDG